LPAYPASEQRLVVGRTKVFPEPIDGEGLLEAITHAEKAARGEPDLFHVVDILQMCCLAHRSGAIQMVQGAKSGIAFLRHGQIVHGETAGGRGKGAIDEIVDWQYVEFAYDRTVRPPVETITQPWEALLVAAVERHKENKVREEQRRSA
jgi:hypothetical protein